MHIFPLPVGRIGANCYIVSVENQCLIVDPGDEAEKIITHIETKGLKPEAILLTHAHFDHIGALEAVHGKYAVPVYAHEKERGYLMRPDWNFSNKMMRTPVAFEDVSFVTFLNEDGTLRLLDQEMKHLHVPGHSLGSLAFYFTASNVLLSGDALFKGTIGRTDLLHGDHEQLKAGIEAKLFTLPHDTVVYPGHGEATTIGDEIATNPHFNE